MNFDCEEIVFFEVFDVFEGCCDLFVRVFDDGIDVEG